MKTRYKRKYTENTVTPRAEPIRRKVPFQSANSPCSFLRRDSYNYSPFSGNLDAYYQYYHTTVLSDPRTSRRPNSADPSSSFPVPMEPQARIHRPTRHAAKSASWLHPSSTTHSQSTWPRPPLFLFLDLERSLRPRPGSVSASQPHSVVLK